jgi:hypothetical protein
MGRKVNVSVWSLVVLGIVAFVCGTLVSGIQPSTQAASLNPVGVWMVAGGDNNGYLVNTMSGEVFRLRGDYRVATSLQIAQK